jgi:hypothetical protein
VGLFITACWMRVRRSDLADFRSFDMVMLTLFRMLLGNFDYLAMHRSNYIVAPLLFTSYMLVLVFLLLNMLAALCVDAYAQLTCKVRQAGLRLRPHCRCAASLPPRADPHPSTCSCTDVRRG